MNDLLQFLQTNVPQWLALILTPLNAMARVVTGTVTPQILMVATPQAVTTLKTYVVPAHPRRKQMIIQADVAIILRTTDSVRGMTLAANIPWTVETTDAFQIYNGTAGTATVEILQFLYA